MLSNQSKITYRESAGPEKMPPQDMDLDYYVDKFLSTMCDSSRRRILELLSAPMDQDVAEDVEQIIPIEFRSTDIAKYLNLSPATTSGHLKQLAHAGIVVSRRQGNAIFYRLSNHYLIKAFRDLLIALDHHYNVDAHEGVRDSD